MIAVQLVSMPLFAAGVINGLGHHSGYRNFECPDAAPTSCRGEFCSAGKELHKPIIICISEFCEVSVRAWEFDIGWLG